MDKTPSENKFNWKPRYFSEFSMGELDFQRHHICLSKCDEVASWVNSTHLPSLELMQQYLAALTNLHDNIRPIIASDKIKEDFDTKIKEGVKMKRAWENEFNQNIPRSPRKIIDFVDLCNELKKDLYDIRQKVGLGIVVRKNMDTRERIKMGMHRNKSKIDNLPDP